MPSGVRLRRVRTVVFDKTGTLTLETPVLKNPEALLDLDGEARAALLALVRDNPHPVSRSLHEALLARGGGEALAGEVTETIGLGVALGEWTLGRSGWNGGGAVAAEGGEAGDVVLARAGRVAGRFQFADTARADARDEIGALTRRGLQVVVLSGDRKEKVATLMRELGLPPDNGYAELSPRDKADWFAEHADALMLGDGANDSLAFDRALCRGTPVVHRGVPPHSARSKARHRGHPRFVRDQRRPPPHAGRAAGVYDRLQPARGGPGGVGPDESDDRRHSHATQLAGHAGDRRLGHARRVAAVNLLVRVG